jgi:enamine deaminase RidA (YjgF/YER057c/UK114 family)
VPAGIQLPHGVGSNNNAFASGSNREKDRSLGPSFSPNVRIPEREMNTNSKATITTGNGPRLVSTEERLKELGIKLPSPPEPFGAYVEAVQTGNLLFVSGMLPTEGHGAKITGRVGAELDVEQGRNAAQLAALNVLAVARNYLGSLDRVTRVVRLGVSVAILQEMCAISQK